MDEKRQWDVAQQLADTTEGVCEDIDWVAGLAEVNRNGQTVRMKWKGEPPWPGGRVRIDVAAKQPVCIPIYGSPMGTVVSVAGSLVTVTGDDGLTYVYPHLGSAPSSGNRVRLDHPGRVVLPGAYSTEPVGSDYTAPGAPPTVGGSAWFTPAWSGHWQDGAYRDAGAQISSVSRAAAYGYGKSIADTIPDAAVVTKAELHLVQLWDETPGASTSMGTHTFEGLPGSLTNANITGEVLFGGGSRVVDLLGSIADALKSGTAYGVAFRSGFGWRRYLPQPDSGRIYMEWRS